MDWTIGPLDYFLDYFLDHFIRGGGGEADHKYIGRDGR